MASVDMDMNEKFHIHGKPAHKNECNVLTGTTDGGADDELSYTTITHVRQITALYPSADCSI